MKNTVHRNAPGLANFKLATGLALIALGVNASAAESSKLRQAPVGVFGGEIAAPADNPGLFGTASLTYLNIYKVADGNGNPTTLPSTTSPLTAPFTAFTFSLPAVPFDFNQNQTQLNLMGGYLTEELYGDGRLAFAINVPLIKQSRSFVPVVPVGTVSPTPPSPAVTAGANLNAANNIAIRFTTPQNAEVSGIGDTELSMVWVRHQDRLKVAAGVSLFVPTGVYDKNRGPNPGFGNFYTLRPGVAVTYALNPTHTDAAWDAGVTVAGRLSYGINTTNKETEYRSGNFIYGELGVIKVMGDWAFGSNLLAIQQVTDDSGSGAPADGARLATNGGRYRSYGIGPFLSYKLPGKDAGFNLQYSDTFGERNAIAVKSLQVRFVKAW